VAPLIRLRVRSLSTLAHRSLINIDVPILADDIASVAQHGQVREPAILPSITARKHLSQ